FYVAEQLLDTAEVGSALEQVGREGVAEEVRMNALRVEAGLRGELPQDEECSGPGQWAAAGVQEELGTVPAVEERPTLREIATDRFRGLPPDRDDPLLVPLTDAAKEALVELDRVSLE